MNLAKSITWHARYSVPQQIVSLLWRQLICCLVLNKRMVPCSYLAFVNHPVLNQDTQLSSQTAVTTGAVVRAMRFDVPWRLPWFVDI